MRFTTLYEELKFSDVFKAATPEEAAKRKSDYSHTLALEIIDKAPKEKLPDGSWYIKGSLCLNVMSLTTLKGLNVSIVEDTFNCNDNLLTTLEGGPDIVRYYDCSVNELIDLKGAPEEVSQFRCNNNYLTNLKGAPKKVFNSFQCDHNELTSLEGAPEEIGHNFDCAGNYLTDLKGAPRVVKGWFNCCANDLTSLEGCPKKVGSIFYCSDNKKKFTKEEVASICEVRGAIVI